MIHYPFDFKKCHADTVRPHTQNKIIEKNRKSLKILLKNTFFAMKADADVTVLTNNVTVCMFLLQKFCMNIIYSVTVGMFRS